MRQNIKTEIHSLSSFLSLKKEVWEVCKVLYSLTEEAYYERLSLFKQFAIFKDGDKIIGFLSFFVDDIVLDSKPIVLIGIGHGGLLPAYRNQGLIQKASFKFLFKKVLLTPFKRHFIWGMATTHLSYRLGFRGTKIQYPALNGNCPPFCKTLLDWIGDKYYQGAYCSSSLTAQIGFAAKGQSIFPSHKELEDPIVANFIQRVPTALNPNNKMGAFAITPLGVNILFWIKKFLLGKQKKRKQVLIPSSV